MTGVGSRLGRFRFPAIVPVGVGALLEGELESQTTAINVGSEYGEGILRGVLLTIGGGKLLRYQAVTG